MVHGRSSEEVGSRLLPYSSRRCISTWRCAKTNFPKSYMNDEVFLRSGFFRSNIVTFEMKSIRSLAALLFAASAAVAQYSGYASVYFKESPDMSGADYNLNLAVSSDGLEWVPLNQNNPVAKPTQGSTGLRDPFVLRKQTGGFVVIATDLKGTDWNYQSQYIHVVCICRWIVSLTDKCCSGTQPTFAASLAIASSSFTLLQPILGHQSHSGTPRVRSMRSCTRPFPRPVTTHSWLATPPTSLQQLSEPFSSTLAMMTSMERSSTTPEHGTCTTRARQTAPSLEHARPPLLQTAGRSSLAQLVRAVA